MLDYVLLAVGLAVPIGSLIGLAVHDRRGKRYAIHLKTGKKYLVLGIVTDCTNARDGEAMMLYRSVTSGQTYVRDLREFQIKFKT